MTNRDHEVLIGFSAVLTHYLGNCAHGGVPDLDDIVRDMREPIPTVMAGPRALVALRVQESGHG
jgi:hypothetical protein